MKLSRLIIPFSAAALILIAGCNKEPVTVATSPDGVKIHFSNQGQGQPAIVLVHGWTNSRAIWDEQVPEFAHRYQVVAVDLAGHGESGDNRSDWTMTAFGQDIAAVVRTLKLKKVILVGFSMGGPAVLEAAKLLPDQLEGVILVDAINNPETQYPPEMVHWIDSAFMDLIANPTMNKLVNYGFFVNNPEEQFKKVQAMLETPRAQWEEILLEDLRWENEDCKAALGALKVPLIAINGDHTPTDVEAFRKYAPSFDLKTISGTGHVLMWDATEEFNDLLAKSIHEINKDEI